MATQPRLEPRFGNGDSVFAIRPIKTYGVGMDAETIPAGSRGELLYYTFGREGWAVVDFGEHGVSDAHESELELVV